jgi:hypothetical protein
MYLLCVSNWSLDHFESELVVFLSQIHNAGTPRILPAFHRAKDVRDGMNLSVLITFLDMNEDICFASTEVTLVAANKFRRQLQSRGLR